MVGQILSSNGDFMEVWGVPSATHASCIKRQNTVLGISACYLIFWNILIKPFKGQLQPACWWDLCALTVTKPIFRKVTHVKTWKALIKFVYAAINSGPTPCEEQLPCLVCMWAPRITRTGWGYKLCVLRRGGRKYKQEMLPDLASH